MITVAILIDGQPLLARTAVNQGAVLAGARTCMYKTDDGGFVVHDPSAGAVALAIKLLRTIHEPSGVSLERATA